MDAGIAILFKDAGCDGQLHVQTLDGSSEFGVHADHLVSPASVLKVWVALEAEAQFADGRLDPHERVVLRAASRTPGPAGFSLFQDDVEVSLRDLVVPVLTISDNVATDELIHRVGIDAINARMSSLGLTNTVLVADIQTTIDSIAQDAGFADWTAMTAWTPRDDERDEEDRAVQRMRDTSVLNPEIGTRTTPRDMTTLLRLIWSDQAAPEPACRRIREVMRQQLTKHRLAAAFPPPARVSAKSGSLIGVVRNEIGVIQFPDGRAYAAAVFTRSYEAGQDEVPINAAVGTAAAKAVAALAES